MRLPGPLLGATALLLAGLVLGAASAQAGPDVGAAFTLRSPAFTKGAAIPVLYTCDGRNVSPALAWSVPPRRTRSLALVVDDPDAPGGTFTHWIAWGIGAATRTLPRGKALLSGVNDARRVGYAGPCPPPGDGPHRYVFRLLALDVKLTLPRGASKEAFRAAIRGHVLARAELVGRYER